MSQTSHAPRTPPAPPPGSRAGRLCRDAAAGGQGPVPHREEVQRAGPEQPLRPPSAPAHPPLAAHDLLGKWAGLRAGAGVGGPRPPVSPVPPPPQLLLPSGVTVEVIVVNIVSAGHVFVQQHTHPTYHALRSLDQQMFLCYSQPSTPALPSPAEGRPRPPVGGAVAPPVLTRLVLRPCSWRDLCRPGGRGGVVEGPGHHLLQGQRRGGDPLRGLRRLRPGEDRLAAADPVGGASLALPCRPAGLSSFFSASQVRLRHAAVSRCRGSAG